MRELLAEREEENRNAEAQVGRAAADMLHLRCCCTALTFALPVVLGPLRL